MVFSQFWDSPWKKSYVEQSVASFTDQREYQVIFIASMTVPEDNNRTTITITPPSDVTTPSDAPTTPAMNKCH